MGWDEAGGEGVEPDKERPALPWPAQIGSRLSYQRPLHPPAPQSRSSLRERCQRLCHPSSLAPPHMPAVRTVCGRRQSPRQDPGGQPKPMPPVTSPPLQQLPTLTPPCPLRPTAGTGNILGEMGGGKLRGGGGRQCGWRPFLGNRTPGP